MSRKKYRKPTSGGKQPTHAACTQNFSPLLDKHIPSFVVLRLRSMKEELRSDIQGLAEAEKTVLLQEVSAIPLLCTEDWNQWSKSFKAVIAKMDKPGFVDLIMQIPDPPAEPLELWLKLTAQAEKKGNTGIAACLMLYSLGCARAFREFKQVARMQLAKSGIKVD